MKRKTGKMNDSMNHNSLILHTIFIHLSIECMGDLKMEKYDHREYK